MRRHVTPERSLPPSAASADIPLSLTGGLRFDAHHVELYERCPRRFFYTHVLQTGGRRKTTPFMQMHEAVRTVFKGVVSGRKNVALNELEVKVSEALAAANLADHGYYEHYHTFALSMIRFFASIREGHTSEEPMALRVVFGAEEIIVMPDDVLIGPDGGRIIRRVTTGHGRKGEEKEVGAAAFLLAAAETFPGAKIELVSLADQQACTVSLKPNELKTRERKLSDYLTEIRAGRFPQKSSSRTCPGCPAFYICGPVPTGTFEPVFRNPPPNIIPRVQV